MTTPLTFVPRAVSKYTKEWQGISRPPPSPPLLPDATTDDDEHDDHDDKHKGKEKAVESAHQKQSQDIASLIALALSDYNIWFDSDLRWKLDACLRDDVSPDDAGCTSSLHHVYEIRSRRQSYPSTTSSVDPHVAVHSPIPTPLKQKS